MGTPQKGTPSVMAKPPHFLAALTLIGFLGVQPAWAIPTVVGTSFTYDGRGNLLSTREQAIGATTTFTYEPVFNQVSSITDPNGNVTRVVYDSKGNPVTITDAQGNATTLTYDARGLLTTVTDALAHTTRFTYDPATRNLLATTDPLGNTSTLAYDSAGNVGASTDAAGRTTQFSYDSMNHLVSVTDAAGGVTRYSYDVAGNLTDVTDANGDITAFEYDAMNRLIRTTNPVGQVERFTYDPTGNLMEEVDAKGQRVRFSYDAANQLMGKILEDASGAATDTVTYAYDAVGTLTQVQDGDSKLTFTYDQAGRLIRATTGDSASPELTQPVTTLTSTYDKAGNRLSLSLRDPAGVEAISLASTYDSLNRLTSSLRGGPGGAEAISYIYDLLSRRTQLHLPNGTETAYTYDAASQLLSLVHRLTALPQTILAQATYSYDPVGNRTSLTDLPGFHSFGYDALNRLIAATHPVAAALPNESYTYDSVGNRLSSHLSSAHRYDAANRLLEDDTFTYSYDANGNLVTKTDKATGATTTYTYDPEDQLVAGTISQAVAGEGSVLGTSFTYRYDGLGRRVEKAVNGVITRYVYDNEDIVLEYKSVRPEHSIESSAGSVEGRKGGLLAVRGSTNSPRTAWALKFQGTSPWVSGSPLIQTHKLM